MEDIHETSSLIGADKVEGTRVFDTGGEELGKIHEIMIDKVSGKVAYAIMSFGGVLGMGEKYSPLPWAALKYDTELGGYVADIDRDRLNAAPEFDVDNPSWDPAYQQRLQDYYGSSYFA